MEPMQLPLKDIHMPEAIGWWPPAIGWWLVAILVPSLIVLLVWLYKRLTRKTAVKTAKKLLARIKQDSTLDNRGKVTELSILIRRVAISVAPRSQAAGLTGQAWLAYLDSSVKGSPFSEGVGRHLSDAPYRNIQLDDAEIPLLIRLCEDWLKAQAKK
jgi:membrane protein implicated in regulation of membrane protease activity